MVHGASTEPKPHKRAFFNLVSCASWLLALGSSGIVLHAATAVGRTAILPTIALFLTPVLLITGAATSSIALLTREKWFFVSITAFVLNIGTAIIGGAFVLGFLFTFSGH